MSENTTPEEFIEFLNHLEQRFKANTHRHKGVLWDDVVAALLHDTSKIEILQKMEETGGEPDVVILQQNSTETAFADCAAESPKNRRSICYDQKALDARKQHKPRDSAENMAANMGVELLSEQEYLALQSLAPIDQKTSSWLKTPADVRAKGGALFGDYRFGRTFVYHNGAESYYAARGFRAKLTL